MYVEVPTVYNCTWMKKFLLEAEYILINEFILEEKIVRIYILNVRVSLTCLKILSEN